MHPGGTSPPAAAATPVKAVKVEAVGALRVTAPNGPAQCAGRYAIVGGERPNGQPLWKHDGEARWMYSGRNGKWHIGGPKAKEAEFKCSMGFVCCPTPHGGRSPHELRQGVVRVRTPCCSGVEARRRQRRVGRRRRHRRRAAFTDLGSVRASGTVVTARGNLLAAPAPGMRPEHAAATITSAAAGGVASNTVLSVPNALPRYNEISNSLP
eukprot:gene22034-biopygen54280